MTKRIKGPANRSHFERWLSVWGGWGIDTIHNARSEFGYEDRGFDIAWAAWNAALDRHPRPAEGKSEGQK